MFDDGEIDFELMQEGIETLSHLFNFSPEFSGLEEECHNWPGMYLELAANYCSVSFLDIGLSDAREILLEMFPRKVSCSPESASQIVSELRNFFRFIDRKFGALHAASLVELFDDRIAAELKLKLGDSSNFGIAKSLFAQASDAGFDVTNEEDIAQFVEMYNSSINLDLPSTDTGSIGMTAEEKKAFNKKRKKQLAKKTQKKESVGSVRRLLQLQFYFLI